MTLRIRDAAAPRTVVEARFRNASNASQPIERMYVRTETGVSQFYQRGIRLAANPPSAAGFSSSKTGPVTSSSVVVSVTGGSAPYTHSWTGSSGIAPLYPASPSTNFIGNPPAQYGEIYGTATDVVTDANGLTASVTVDVTLSREA